VLQGLVSTYERIRRTGNTDHHSGRTTFVNTLCGKKVLKGKDADDPTNAHLEDGVKIKPVTVGT
jgi:septin family protein